MKRIYYFCMLLAVAAITACSSDELVDNSVSNLESQNNVMSFNVSSKNMTRATSAMESLGLYNFGVWAYKKTSDSPLTYQTVMDNYLVGYQNPDPTAPFRGYAGGPSTIGDSKNLTDGKSNWFYEGLGKDEYIYTEPAGTEYYRKTQNIYMSNNDKQYLKYWDNSAIEMNFYAYAPYRNSTYWGSTVVFYNDTKRMAFPPINALKNDARFADYMVAEMVTRRPGDANYRHDVPLHFTRITSQVRFAFYEVIDGYDVELIDWELDGTKSRFKAEGNILTKGQYVHDFSLATPKGEFTGTEGLSGTTLEFALPVPTETTPVASTAKHPVAYNKIHETNLTASKSADTYYALPYDGNGDLTFTVSFKLHSLDTDEIITVQNATVVVPAAKNQWEPNTKYTYIFKITKDANGTTGPGLAGLYPIVFDGIEVDEWDTDESEWIISQVAMSKQLITLDEGASTTVDAILNYEGETKPTNYNVAWTVAPTTGVVAIEETPTTPTDDNKKSTAKIKATGAGTAHVTAAAETSGKSATTTVTVPLVITSGDEPVVAGDTKTLTTNVVNKDVVDPAAGDVVVTWTSSNETVATVVKGSVGDKVVGIVTGVVAGTATIKATITQTLNGYTYTQEKTFEVTVTAPVVP